MNAHRLPFTWTMFDPLIISLRMLNRFNGLTDRVTTTTADPSANISPASVKAALLAKNRQRREQKKKKKKKNKVKKKTEKWKIKRATQVALEWNKCCLKSSFHVTSRGGRAARKPSLFSETNCQLIFRMTASN